MMDYIKEELERLEKEGLYRTLKKIDKIKSPTRVYIKDRELLLFSSNNYLGLTHHPDVIKAGISAIQEWGCGSSASRLISGNFILHEALEKALADFKGSESAILFSSGYAANVGTIQALVKKGDLILSDKLNHASIIDGCRLSLADLRIYKHKSTKRLKELLEKSKGYRRRLIVTDSVFSMDGDIAPLVEIVNIKEKYDAMLMVDEAHAVGVLGEHGAGAVEYFGLKGKIEIQMGTLSKALASQGGYVTGKKELIEYLRNTARSFIYSTALSPSQVATAFAVLNVIKNDPSLRERLWKNTEMLKNGLNYMQFDTMESETPIIPVLVGDVEKTKQLAEFLLNEGIYAPAIRPPSVPKNSSRIRLSVSASHTKSDIEKLLEAFEKARKMLF